MDERTAANEGANGGEGPANGREPRTEGQRLLCAIPGPSKGIVEAIGASKGAVSEWRSGSKVPGREWRARLEAAFGIPALAWDRRPLGAGAPVLEAPSPAPRPADASSGPARPKLSAPVPPPPPEAQGATMGQVDELLASLADERADPTLTAAERARVSDAYTKALALKARLEREAELLEDRVVREHPFWARLRAAILEALRAHPAAARDVADALARLGV